MLLALGLALGTGLFLGDALAFRVFLRRLLAGDTRLLLGGALAFGFFLGGLLTRGAGLFIGLTLGARAGLVLAAQLFALGVPRGLGLFLGDALAFGLPFGGQLRLALLFGAGRDLRLPGRLGHALTLRLHAGALLGGGALFPDLVHQRAVELRRHVLQRAAGRDGHAFEFEGAQGCGHHRRSRHRREMSHGAVEFFLLHQGDEGARFLGRQEHRRVQNFVAQGLSNIGGQGAHALDAVERQRPQRETHVAEQRAKVGGRTIVAGVDQRAMRRFHTALHQPREVGGVVFGDQHLFKAERRQHRGRGRAVGEHWESTYADIVGQGPGAFAAGDDESLGGAEVDLGVGQPLRCQQGHRDHVMSTRLERRRGRGGVLRRLCDQDPHNYLDKRGLY